MLSAEFGGNARIIAASPVLFTAAVFLFEVKKRNGFQPPHTIMELYLNPIGGNQVQGHEEEKNNSFHRPILRLFYQIVCIHPYLRRVFPGALLWREKQPNLRTLPWSTIYFYATAMLLDDAVAD